MGLCHVLFKTLETSPEKLTLTVVEMQQLPDLENTESKDDFSLLKRTIYKSGRKVCVNLKTGSDKLHVVVSTEK